ncbi:MAG TPA: valine--tRNA ligase [Caulobacterales bacterium]|nr:valine--tRNA ligase [Caulobacterales bacterium]
MLDTNFDPKAVEASLYEAWESSGAFKPRASGAAFSIVIPPPNVTGSLHIGHALNNTLQDILARFERMRGKAVLWQPGMDHAGIATQIVVERQLAEQGNMDRRALGREEFVKRIWAWKEESGGTITRQLRRLGASCDWSRERFTMDEGLSRAVLKVFVQLYKEGLIYKDKRLVNWDPKLQTAVSDLEVENIETKGKLWRIKYPLADDASRFVVVATTRPETMLGDVAVAVHPGDERYTALIGKMVRLPLTDRAIPVIADDYADPEKGSGAVKITPAHDFNDFEVGKRHKLAPIEVIDREAQMSGDIPERFREMDRFEARKQILAELEQDGLLDGAEDIVHAVPHDEKTKLVILEPMLTEQWYVDAKKLAGPAIAAVESGKTKFTPENFANTYFHWMHNIQPWCVSRQLWWGHQIPAWYAPDGKVFVEESEDAAKAAAKAHFKKDVPLTRDEDVLDTWFSSALWAFSTMGWPDETPEVKRFYPTSVLVTMYDIIFFWVARMMMMGLHFMKDVPFHNVLIHARVVDEKGAKMSKTKGNVVDPLVLIDEYGADALRLTLAMKAAPGKDVRMGRGVVESYRNFGTKFWNAARFCQMNECVNWNAFDPTTPKHTINRWIVGELTQTAATVTAELEAYRFNEAAGALYKFVWNVFCDWYIELIKPLLNGSDEATLGETRATAAWVLEQVIRLLHPFMPFITEELWTRLGEFGPKRERMLIVETWPDLPESLIDPKAAEEINWLIGLVSETRSARAELNVPAGAKIPLLLVGAAKESCRRLERHQELIDRLARLDYSTTADAAPTGSVTFVHGEATVALQLEGVVDFSAEAERLVKEINRLDGEIAKIDGKLGNAEFVRKAPKEVVEEQRERRAEAQAAKAKLEAALQRLRAAV